MFTRKISLFSVLFIACGASYNRAESKGSFPWNNCRAGDLATVKTFSISPSPVVIPGSVTVEFEGTSTIDAVSPLKTKLTIKRKIGFFWVEVPCVDGVGSCDYDDICSVLDKYFPPSDPCPPIFDSNHIPCHCPVPKGDYKIPESTVDIPTDPLPSWLSDGQYSIKVDVGTNFACVQFDLTLGSGIPTVNLIA